MVHGFKGAFSFSDSVGDAVITTQGANLLQNEDRISFNANKFNSVYGSSNTIQPAALSCKLCIKY
nr:MAG TPA: hypothetical protein [Caudoviricetes sp.]